MSNLRGTGLRIFSGKNRDSLFDGIANMSINMGKVQKALLSCVSSSNIGEVLDDISVINSFLEDIEKELSEKYDYSIEEVRIRDVAKSCYMTNSCWENEDEDIPELSAYWVKDRTEGLAAKLLNFSKEDFEVSKKGHSGRKIKSLKSRNSLKKTIINGGSGYIFVSQTLPASLVEYLNRIIDVGRFDVIKDGDSNKKCFYFVHKKDDVAIKKLEEHRKAKQRAKSMALKNDYLIYFWGSEEAYKGKLVEWESLLGNKVKVTLEYIEQEDI